MTVSWEPASIMVSSCHHDLCDELSNWAKANPLFPTLVLPGICHNNKKSNQYSFGTTTSSLQPCRIFCKRTGIPKGCFYFFVSSSTHEGSASDCLLCRLVTSNVLHGERLPLNQDAFTRHLIYLSHSVLGYKGTKDQVPSINIPNVV